MPTSPNDPATSAAGPVLMMVGDVDIGTESDWLRRGTELLGSHPGVHDLTIDMRDVGFIDSRGLAVLVALHSTAMARGGRLALRAVPRRVARALTVAGLDTVFDVATAP